MSTTVIRVACKKHKKFSPQCEQCMDENNMFPTGMTRYNFRQSQKLGRGVNNIVLTGDLLHSIKRPQ